MSATVQERITKIVAEQHGTAPDLVKPDSSFASLGADSLDQLEIVMEIEHQFGIQIDDDEAEKLTHVALAVSYVTHATLTVSYVELNPAAVKG